MQQALVEHCETRRDRMALLDPPVSTIVDPGLGTAPIEAWRQRFDSRHAALYFPWLVVVDPLGSGIVRTVPPSGHVAGQYALADEDHGHRQADERGRRGGVAADHARRLRAISTAPTSASAVTSDTIQPTRNDAGR